MTILFRIISCWHYILLMEVTWYLLLQSLTETSCKRHLQVSLAHVALMTSLKLTDLSVFPLPNFSQKER